MIQLYNDRKTSGDFKLVNKADPNESYQVHLFVLVARSSFFNALIDTPMLEANKMESVFEVPKEIKRPIFKEFVKFLYFDEIQISNPMPSVDEIIYLCELCDFYGLTNSRLKHFAEN